MKEISASIKAGTFKDAEVAAIEKETAAIKAEIEQARAKTAALKQEAAQLEKENAKLKIERDYWKAKAEPASKQLAAAIAEHGISRPGRVNATVRPSLGSLTTLD
jgi:hypothetical protein